MVRKGKGKNRKGNPKQQEAIFGSSSYNVDSDSDEEIPFHVSSRYSAKAVNCTACLKPKDGHRHNYEADVKQIMDIFGKRRPTIESIQRALQLLNQLVDSYQSPIDEIHRQGLDVILVQGTHFENPKIQYYAIHALSVIIVYMDETQLKSLIPRGLLTGLTAALQSDMLFIVQEAIEACSSIAIKSAAMRDVVAACGSLHISELLSKYYQTISKEFARTVATFLRDLCCPKPVPEFVLKHVTNSARYLLRHEENEIRVAALGAIYEVIGNKDFTVTFEDSYVELILKFLDSPRRNEVKVAFKIASELAQQLNCNTDEIIKAGFIRKTLSILAQNSASNFGHETCLILASLLSNKKYIEPVMESGLVLLLLGLMDRGTKSYKNEAYAALTSMSKSLDRRNARKLANPAYLEKMCNVLSSENKNYVVCALALMNCMLQACSKGRAKRRLKLATKYIRESEAYEYILEYMNNECYKIRNLADKIHNGYLINIQLSDNDEDDEGEEVG